MERKLLLKHHVFMIRTLEVIVVGLRVVCPAYAVLCHEKISGGASEVKIRRSYWIVHLVDMSTQSVELLKGAKIRHDISGLVAK